MTKQDDDMWKDREPMRYAVRLQHMSKGAGRPSENELPEMYATDKEFALLPNVGDYVHYDNSFMRSDTRLLRGRVKSRLFQYARSEAVGIYCAITIVIEDAEDDDWGALSKD